MSRLMPSAPPSSASRVDTILTLPRQVGALAIAHACRTAGLEFLNESDRWGKPELAMWLMGSYAQLTQYVVAHRRGGEAGSRPAAPLLREIDARMVERVVRSAHEQVVAALRGLASSRPGSGFALAMVTAGFVVRCEDRAHVAGWVPTPNARRLADRVLSLLAVDYLARPADYLTELAVCRECAAVEFEADARARGTCERHGSSMVGPTSRRSTVPYTPERA